MYSQSWRYWARLFGLPDNHRLLPLDISFKENVQDTGSSHALRIAGLLVERGADIVRRDSHMLEINLSGKQFHSFDLGQVSEQQFNGAVILVNHSYFNL